MRHLIIMLCLGCSIHLIAGTVATSKHNLSVSGPGEIKSQDTGRVCVFCHTPHTSESRTPLWNKNMDNQVYSIYSSSTMKSMSGQPDGTSKLCLSCHDGTVAVGRVKNPNVTFNMGGTPGGLLSGGSNLGRNLSDDHPVSFVPIQDDSLLVPNGADGVMYDDNGKLQCTTCHDPHDSTFEKFLVKSNLNGGLCTTCHNLTGYFSSAHHTSPAGWNNVGIDPWPATEFQSVSENSCANCHRSHGSGTAERLLTQNNDDKVCRVCHSGNVARYDVFQDINKASAHLTSAYTGIHDPTEDVYTMPQHVECVDCHNPHSVREGEDVPPVVSGLLHGVVGVDINGLKVDEAVYEYQVCIKCHGDNPNFNRISFINRQVNSDNLRLAINPGNPSYHPIAAAGRASSVPSLRPEYTESSRIYCTDCHNSDSSVNAGGSGPNGPHGSIHHHILERRYDTTDYTSYSTAAYALCFKCHDPNVLMSGTSTFRGLHRRHVIRESMPCSICHDPHGVSQGTPEDGDHVGLINFDLNVVQPDSGGRLRFEVDAIRGTCYMSCHGTEHSPKFYGR